MSQDQVISDCGVSPKLSRTWCVGGHRGREERIDMLLKAAELTGARIIDDYIRLARHLFSDFNPATHESYAVAAFRIRRGQRS